MDLQELALIVAPAIAILALIYGLYLATKVLKEDEGTPHMKQIAQAIRDGSATYLKRQFKTIIGFMIVLALVLLFAIKPFSIGLGTAFSFILGAVLSSVAGYFGMWMATRANVRTANASLKGLNPALKIAFDGGTVNGMLITGLGLLGVSVIFIIYRNQATQVLIGFGFGAALLALFMRVGGGIFTKAADVGADIVGKIEANIPEDDPRNAAVIADNVGDNVGDCAGMGADVFESYAITIIAAMILGQLTFGIRGVIFPLLARSGGIVASIIGTFVVRGKEGEHPFAPIFKGFLLSAIAAAGLFFIFAKYVLVGASGTITAIGGPFKGQVFTYWQIWLASLVGLSATVLIGIVTNHYTSTQAKPVREIAKAAQTGAATSIITGLSFGFESAFVTILIVSATIAISYSLAGAYGIAIAGMGMLATTGIIVSMDTFGPIADNAQGISEMAGLGQKSMEIMNPLDSVGNTTKALTKGFAISSAAVAAVSLFATYIQDAKLPQGIRVDKPIVLVGLFLGAALPFIFSAQTIKAVGRTAYLVVEEVRRQFREIEGLMKGEASPDYSRVVDISTIGALKELTIPALIVILFPVVTGFVLGRMALGGFLVGAIVSAQLMAIFQVDAGGAWDNAKKYIEDGHFGGKFSETHKAAVTIDTVGDPLKDTSGPALNPMVKIVNIISLLILPLLLITGSLIK